MIKTDPLAAVNLAKMKTTGHHPWEPAECGLSSKSTTRSEHARDWLTSFCYRPDSRAATSFAWDDSISATA